jgi:hypothetical protein
LTVSCRRCHGEIMTSGMTLVGRLHAAFRLRASAICPLS